MKKTESIIRSTTGSLLIWSVLLGFLLTSVFFFFSVRQRATIAIQQDTAQILNTRQYLESYADYLEKYIKSLHESVPDEKSKLDNLRENGVQYDEITGTATNVVSEITGVADADVPVTYNFSGDIFIEWNKCSDNPVECNKYVYNSDDWKKCVNNSKGILYINEVLYEHNESDVCNTTDLGYDDLIGPIAVTNPFIISTLNAPFHYHITPKDAATDELIDNKWQLDIKKDLDYGKKIEVKRVF